MSEKLFSIKELAFELGRCRRYVTAMKAQGFKMPGGRATVAEARSWLEKHPNPCSVRTAAQPCAPAGLVRVKK